MKFRRSSITWVLAAAVALALITQAVAATGAFAPPSWFLGSLPVLTVALLISLYVDRRRSHPSP